GLGRADAGRNPAAVLDTAPVTCRTAWPPEVEFLEPQRRAIVAVTAPAYPDQAARPAPERRERADPIADRPELGLGSATMSRVDGAPGRESDEPQGAGGEQVVCELTQAAR